MKHLLIATIAGLGLVMMSGGILVAIASSPLYQTAAMKTITSLAPPCDKGPINPPNLVACRRESSEVSHTGFTGKVTLIMELICL
jgi:hypothetical protein